MRAVKYLIVFFLLLHSMTYAMYLDASFSRPWEEEYIIKAEYVSSILEYESDYHTSISYLYYLDQEEQKSLSNEINRIKEANRKYAELATIRNKIYNDLLDILKLSAVSYFEVAIALATNWNILFVKVVEDVIEITSKGYKVLSMSNEYYSTLMDSLEYSELAYNGVLSKVMQNYEDLEKMGINDKEYAGAQVNNIALLNSELDYFDYNELKNRENNIVSKLSSIPKKSVYNSLISLSTRQIEYLIDGDKSVVSHLLNAYSISNEIKRELVNENNLFSSKANTQFSKVNSHYKEVYSNYYDITDSEVLFFGFYSLETLETPRTHIEKSRGLLEEARLLMDEGSLIYNSKQDGYVTKSTSKYIKAIDKINSAEFELNEAKNIGDKILSYAENVTREEYEQAKKEVSSFVPHTETEVALLNAAKKELSNAEEHISKGNTVSDRLDHLKKALSSIRTARAYISNSKVFYENVKANSYNNLKYLKSVIDLAKSDSIDVSYEEDFYKRSMLGLESGNLNTQDMLNISEMAGQLTEGVFNKGAAQYNNLWLRYESQAKVVEYLKELGESVSQYDKLSYYVGENGFDKYKSLGHYKEISSLLDSIDQQIKLKSRDIIKQSLVSNANTAYSYDGVVYLNKPVTVKASFSTYSTLDKLNYNGPITISIPFKQDITRFSTVTNPYNLKYSYNNGQLTVTIDSFKPNTLYTLEFSDQQPLAQVTSTNQNMEIVSNSRIKLTVEQSILTYTIPSLVVAPQYDYKYSLYVDGNYEGDYFGETVVNKQMREGRHTIKYVYNIDNPIVTMVTDTVSDSTSTTITFNVINKVDLDIENAQISLDIPVFSSKPPTVTSSGCEVRKSNSVNVNNYTKVNVVFAILPRGSSCDLTVYAYSVINRSFLDDEINNIIKNNTNNDPEVDSYVRKVRDYLNSGRYDEAYKEINNVREVLKQKKEEAAQSTVKKEEISKLESLINSTIERFSSVKNEEIVKTLGKIKSYYEEAQRETSLDKKLSLLSKAASEVYNLDSKAYSISFELTSKLNRLKQRWLYLIDKGYAKDLPDEVSLIESRLKENTNTSLFSVLGEVERLLSDLESKTSLAESDEKKWESSLEGNFKRMQSKLRDLNAQLIKSCSSKCPHDLISQVQMLLTISPSTPKEYEEVIGAINASIQSVDSYLQTQRSSANAAIGELRSAIDKVTDQQDKEILMKKLYDIEALYERGEYEKAKDYASAILNSMYSSSQKPSNDYTLILAGLAVVVISFILIKIRGDSNKMQNEMQKQLKREQ